MNETGPQNIVTASKTTAPSIASLLVRLITVLLMLATILFGSAGRLDWLQAWLLILAYGGFLAYYGAWTLHNDPGQLQERSRAGQNTKSWDRLILAIYTLLLIALLGVAGLDAGRYQWSHVSLPLQILGWLGLILAGWMILWTTSVNTFLSRTVRIQADRGQQVITSGPYRLVRHPMYLGLIVMMICVPLLLGSGWAVLPGGLIGVLFTIRTALEDRTLKAELPGYIEYARQTPFRLFPGIW